MTQNQQNELGKTLWNIADTLRGSMDADDFRDYMLSLLFLRNLSDRYEIAAIKELGSDYNGSLAKWYDENKDDIEVFESQMRKKIHYVIKPEYLWSNIAELARKHDGELLGVLSKGFDFIENESFGSTFKGLFSEINLYSEKLGKDLSSKNEKLCVIINKIADGINKFSEDTDNLGDAYEYLIAQFASGSGQKAGEFYTPQQISTILSQIVTLDSANPKIGTKKNIEKVLDFACGSGSLLLNVRNQMKDRGIGKIYGQEKNITTYNLARMNMLLHGVKDTEFEIFHGDTLINEWYIFREMNPVKKLEFDAIVANPPFSLRWETKEETANDFRFKDYGVAPKSAADFAFLLHGFHFLKKDGTMAIILPHGVLFRGGVEERIRTKLLNDNNIDAIIGLPANLFYSTGISVCIIVLKKCKNDDNVLFINASKCFEKGKRQNILRDDHINMIVDAYKNRSESKVYTEGDNVKDKNLLLYSRPVSMNEIQENGYNLNITRYVNISKEEVEVDLNIVNAQLKEIDVKMVEAQSKLNVFLKELGLPEI